VYAARAPRASIQARLRGRFEALAGKPADCFRKAAIALSTERRTCETVGGAVAHCALAGFLDPQGRRVGCLGHPTVTGGPDLRDLGTFGEHTCEAFQCPSAGVLTDEEIVLARDGCDDWYLYGLVISDVAFLRACLRAVESEAGHAVALRHLEQLAVRASLRSLLALKEGAAPFGDGLQPGQNLRALAQRVARAMATVEPASVR
jgi:hypothetical protein